MTSLLFLSKLNTVMVESSTTHLRNRHQLYLNFNESNANPSDVKFTNDTVRASSS